MLAVRLYHSHFVFAMGDGIVHTWLNQSVPVSDKNEASDPESQAPSPRPNPAASAPSRTCVRSRSRSPYAVRVPAYDNLIGRGLQRGIPMEFECDHDSIWPIFARGDVLLFEPVGDVHPYASEIRPLDVVFCQPTDGGPYNLCTIWKTTGSCYPAESSVSTTYQQAAVCNGYESVAEDSWVPDWSAASAPQAGDESTGDEWETLWDMYNGDEICVGRCMKKRVYGRLQSVKQNGSSTWRLMHS